MNASNNKHAACYHRVSTKKQGESGLGLDAQRSAVENYCRANGLTVSKTFTEIESGKRSDRPQLAAALAHCKRTGAKLIVAKLDRLARNVAFLSKLMESGVEFVAVDNPSANRLTIHILSAVAEAEAAAISARTKAALTAAKARGTLLGSARPGHWNKNNAKARLDGLAAACKVTARLKHERALAAVADLLPIMRQGRQDGQTFQAVADKLNADGHTTSRGNAWTAVGVIQVLRRFAA